MCLWTHNNEKERDSKREKGEVGGRERTKTLRYTLLASGGGHRGERKDRQTNDVLSEKV